MSKRAFYRPYHDRDCPARVADNPDTCTCGGRKTPLYDEGLRGKAGKLAHRMWTAYLRLLR